VTRIIFSELARADVRRLDRDTAMRILSALHRFAETGQGDVKRLKGQTEELRLRVGDYRVRFIEESDSLHINRVLHRKEAYR
jgi:mRNA interferase RelE/StbE